MTSSVVVVQPSPEAATVKLPVLIVVCDRGSVELTVISIVMPYTGADFCASRTKRLQCASTGIGSKPGNISTSRELTAIQLACLLWPRPSARKSIAAAWPAYIC